MQNPKTKADVDRRTWRIGFWTSTSAGLLAFIGVIIGTYFGEPKSYPGPPNPAASYLQIVSICLYFIALLILPGTASVISWDQSYRWSLIPLTVLFLWQCFYFQTIEILSCRGFLFDLPMLFDPTILIYLLPVPIFELLFYSLCGVISHYLVFFVWNRYNNWKAMPNTYHYFGLPARKKEDPTVWPPPPSR